jgi:hypothetical protein
MPTLSKINDILCSNINKIDDILKANSSKIDDIDFCTPTATPTPTVTIGGTPTPTPSVTFTQTPTITKTPTPTVTITPSVTNTQTPTVTKTPKVTLSPTPTPTTTPAPANCIQGTIQKKVNYSYTECCEPFALITGTTVDVITVCYNPNSGSTNVTPVSPRVVCDTNALTHCCDIYLGYSDIDFSTACAAEARLFYFSVPCLERCAFELALNIYTDANCTNVAPDGYYSDGTNFYVMSGGVISGPFSC